MKLRMLWILPLALSLMAAAPTPTNATRVRKVACLGDSNTRGYATGSAAWCARLQQLQTGTKLGTANHGFSGEQCSQLLTRAQAAIFGHGYTGLLLACVTNDCINGTATATTQANILSIVQGALDDGIAVTVMTAIQQKGSSGYTAGRQTCLDTNNTWILSTLPGLVTGPNTTLLSTLDWRPAFADGVDPLICSATYCQGDKIHLNAAGQGRAATELDTANPTAISYDGGL